MGRASAWQSIDLGAIPFAVILKTLTVILTASLVDAQRNRVSIIETSLEYLLVVTSGKEFKNEYFHI